MSSITITGSQGFIGSYLCKEFLDRGYTVVGIDNYSKYGRVVRPHDDHENFTLVERDLTQSFPEVYTDYLIAGAAMIGGISYFHKYAYDLLATNERILGNTFDHAIKAYKDGLLKKIVVISSSMVFENTSIYPTPEIEVETCPPPSSTYGFQKLSSEYWCKGAYEQYGLPYNIVRPFNCVGVGEEDALDDDKITVGNSKMMLSHVLPDLINRALNSEPDDVLDILGDGSQVRHYTNGEDIARGIRMVVEDAGDGEDFNISTDVPTTVKELAELVWGKVHGNVPTLRENTPFEYDVQVRRPDVSKARELLGFEAQVSLSDSVDEVIQYMRKSQ